MPTAGDPAGPGRSRVCAATVCACEMGAQSAPKRQIGRSIPRPGIGAERRSTPMSSPPPPKRMFLRHITEYTPSAAEHEFAASTEPGRTTTGPLTDYHSNGSVSTHREDRDRFRRGDVPIQVTADNTWIPPTGSGAFATPFRFRTPATRSPTSCAPGSTSTRYRYPTPRNCLPTSDTPTPGCVPTTASSPSLRATSYACETPEPGSNISQGYIGSRSSSGYHRGPPDVRSDPRSEQIRHCP